MNRQVSNTEMEAALPISEVFFLYLGHNIWSNFNRWAAEYSPGEQKLVSLFLPTLVPPVPLLCREGVHHQWFVAGNRERKSLTCLRERTDAHTQHAYSVGTL